MKKMLIMTVLLWNSNTIKLQNKDLDYTEKEKVKN